MALSQMLDKDNSKTLEKEEVCNFVKKLINVVMRNIKSITEVSLLQSLLRFYV